MNTEYYNVTGTVWIMQCKAAGMIQFYFSPRQIDTFTLWKHCIQGKPMLAFISHLKSGKCNLLSINRVF